MTKRYTGRETETYASTDAEIETREQDSVKLAERLACRQEEKPR